MPRPTHDRMLLKNYTSLLNNFHHNPNTNKILTVFNVSSIRDE